MGTLIAVGFGVLVRQVYNFEPGLDLTGVSQQAPCDLVMGEGSFENAFVINLRSSRQLSFNQVKAIDVAWQLLAG